MKKSNKPETTGQTEKAKMESELKGLQIAHSNIVFDVGQLRVLHDQKQKQCNQIEHGIVELKEKISKLKE